MARFILTLLIGTLASLALASTPSTIQLQGRLVKSDGTPVDGAAVQFTIEVLSPISATSNSQSCILYRENHEVNMVGSNGVFTVSIGAGTSVSNVYSPIAADSADAFLRVFSNIQPERTGLSCVFGDKYQPQAGDLRYIRIKFNDGLGEQTVPKLHEIASVPYALQAGSASKLGGLSRDNFVEVDTSVSPTLGQTLKWNGTKWAPADDVTGVTVETDPNVRTFAKNDLPVCGPGQILNSDGASLSCVADQVRATPPDATTSSKGIVQVGTGLSVAAGVVSVGTIGIANVSGLQASLDDKINHSQLPSVSCGPSRVLTYLSVTDTYSCENISIAGSQVSGNIAGNAAGFTGSLAGDVTGTQSSTVVERIQNRPVSSTAPSSGQVLKWNGSAWTPSADTDTNSGGTVTSVTAGTGLTGGTITTAGTLAVDVGTGPGQIVQLNGSSQIPAVSGALLTNLNASNISTGTVSTARLGSGTASAATFLRGDGSWAEPASGGGGRTSCPAGYTLIGTSGDSNAYCISSAEQASTTWIGAVSACYGQTPRAILCSVQHWAMACVSGAVANMTDDAEWVSDLGYNGSNGIVIGGGSCSTANIDTLTNNHVYRCCLQ